MSYLDNEIRQNVPPCFDWFPMCGYLWRKLWLHCNICVRSACFSVFMRLPGSWAVMPQIASFQDSAHLWYLNDKSSKIHIYATWSKALKRHSKPNLLCENNVSKCLPGKTVKTAKPRGHGEWADRCFTLCLRFPCSLWVRSCRWYTKLLSDFCQL